MVDFKKMDNEKEITRILKEMVRDVNGYAKSFRNPIEAKSNPQIKEICKMIDIGRTRLRELREAERLAEAVWSKYIWEN